MKANVLLVLGATLSLLLVVSCASVPSTAKMQKSIKGYELPMATSSDSALVYIFRPSGFSGSAVSWKIYVDQKEEDNLVGSAEVGQYIYFKVTPGKHIIISTLGLGKVKNMELIAEASKTYFIEANGGSLAASPSLISTDELTGKYFVIQKTKPGMMK